MKLNNLFYCVCVQSVSRSHGATYMMYQQADSLHFFSARMQFYGPYKVDMYQKLFKELK
jgi:hypothetical protein